MIVSAFPGSLLLSLPHELSLLLLTDSILTLSLAQTALATLGAQVTYAEASREGRGGGSRGAKFEYENQMSLKMRPLSRCVVCWCKTWCGSSFVCLWPNGPTWAQPNVPLPPSSPKAGQQLYTRFPTVPLHALTHSSTHRPAVEKAASKAGLLLKSKDSVLKSLGDKEDAVRVSRVTWHALSDILSL